MIWSIREEEYDGVPCLKVNCPAKTMIFYNDKISIEMIKKFVLEGIELKKKYPIIDIMEYVEYCLEENDLI